MSPSGPRSQETGRLSLLRAGGGVAALAALCLPALTGHEVVAQVAGLHTLAGGPHPYWQPSHGGLLYLWAPMVAISGFVLFLAPGALLALALGLARRVEEWVVLAFACSLTLSALLGTGAKLIAGPPLTWHQLAIVWLGAWVAATLLLGWRLANGAELWWPLASGQDRRRVLWMAGATHVGIAALVPKIFWEDFNVDGVEAFEFGRSLGHHLLPYWELHDGVFGFYHNFVLFAYPNHWFLSHFGPYEATARLPYFLYLAVVFAGLLLLIEHGARSMLSWREESAIWLGLALYTVVQVFNTNYEPFFADLAEMAATDTLFAVCFLAACWAFWTERWVWLGAFGVMTSLASPGGLLLLGGLAIAIVASASNRRWTQVKALGVLIAACTALGASHEILYNRGLLGGVNDQFSAWNLLRRLYPPTVTEFARLNALLFPSGILPACSLLFVRRRDTISWALAGATLVYFGVMYVQVWTTLHQFTPVMLLPTVVFWRLYLGRSRSAQQWLLPGVIGGITLALTLSLPRHFEISLAGRELGLATAYRVGDYERRYEQAVGAGDSLDALLPSDYRLQYPDQPWGMDSNAWIYYATRQKPAGTLVNYIVQPTSEPAPEGFTRVGEQGGVGVYVRDPALWRRHREPALPRVVQSRLYEPIYRRTYAFFGAYAKQARDRAITKPPAEKH